MRESTGRWHQDPARIEQRRAGPLLTRLPLALSARRDRLFIGRELDSLIGAAFGTDIMKCTI
jgi:hypothetical protein